MKLLLIVQIFVNSSIMMNYIIFLTFFFNLLFPQSYKIVPSIIEKDGVAFKVNEEFPYTGKVSVFWGNDTLKEEGIYRDGIKSGLWKYWFNSGQLFSKGIYRNNPSICTFNTML